MLLDDVLAGRKPIQPLAIRANIGDCVAVTLTSLAHDANDLSGFSKQNIHIHHVQFDTQASDGVVTGMSYEQTIRPFQAEDPQITQDAAIGDTTISLSSVTKFQTGEWIAAYALTEPGVGSDAMGLGSRAELSPESAREIRDLFAVAVCPLVPFCFAIFISQEINLATDQNAMNTDKNN